MKHMKIYGQNNNERMSDKFETSCYDEFSFDINKRCFDSNRLRYNKK